eukprot:scaffold13918_cov122-Isochrysis_galbana.AAC.4
MRRAVAEAEHGRRSLCRRQRQAAIEGQESRAGIPHQAMMHTAGDGRAATGCYPLHEDEGHHCTLTAVKRRQGHAELAGSLSGGGRGNEVAKLTAAAGHPCEQRCRKHGERVRKQVIRQVEERLRTSRGTFRGCCLGHIFTNGDFHGRVFFPC